MSDMFRIFGWLFIPLGVIGSFVVFDGGAVFFSICIVVFQSLFLFAISEVLEHLDRTSTNTLELQSIKHELKQVRSKLEEQSQN